MSRPLYRRLRSGALALLLPCLVHTVGRLPYRALRGFGRGLGWLLYRTNGRYRRRSLEHLEIAFPELPLEERKALCRECFFHSAMNAAEALQLLARGRRVLERRMVAEGWEHVEALRSEGRRILLLTAHCGFWELLAAECARHELPLFAVGRRSDEKALRTFVTALRGATGAETIERGSPGAPRLLRRALSGDGALVMLIDQDTKVDGVLVPFFDRPAYTPTGAAEIAVKHGLEVVPALLSRGADGTHTVRFEPPLELPDDVTEATARMTAVVEAHVRRHPAQWVWWHRRWRRTPDEA